MVGNGLKALDVSRSSELRAELVAAIRATPREEISNWGQRSALKLVEVTARRIMNPGRLLVSLGRLSRDELGAAFVALQQGQFKEHLGDRTATMIDTSTGFARDATQRIGAIGRQLMQDPRSHAPEVFGLVIGFYAGSGGLDGDGGVPDLDLLAGIGAHRSIFTHSIFAGAIIETALLSLTDLSDTVHKHFPETHDPLWDTLAAAKVRVARALIQGTSAGIGYHLMVDATIQPAAYKDWPFEMQLKSHQALLAANAVAETLDVAHKAPTRKTVGRQVVDRVDAVSTRAGTLASGLVRHFKAGWDAAESERTPR